MNKDLYIKIVYHDSTRLIGVVYNEDGLVAEKMLASGWAEYNNRESLNKTELSKATKYAQDKKIGLYNFPCSQITNPDSKICLIKGEGSPG